MPPWLRQIGTASGLKIRAYVGSNPTGGTRYARVAKANWHSRYTQNVGLWGFESLHGYQI